MRKVGSLHGCTSKCVARSGVLRETTVAKLNFDSSTNLLEGKELAREDYRVSSTRKMRKLERASPCNYAVRAVN